MKSKKSILVDSSYNCILNGEMRLVACIFFSSVIFTSFLISKSRLSEYYYGFGYAMVDGGASGDVEGTLLNLSATNPASDSTDFVLSFNYGNIEALNADNTSWELGLDYVFHYDDYLYQNGMFRPFGGFGISYLDDGAKIRMADDGFTWKIIGGIEILFTDYFSMSLGANFLGLLADLGQNDFTVDVGLTWWVNEVHGVAIEYNHAFDQEMNFIGLKYLYSWQ